MLAAKLESGAKRVKRSFARPALFETDARINKRQAVSAALPKLSPAAACPSSPTPASPGADADACAPTPAPSPVCVYVRDSRLAERTASPRGTRVQFGSGTKGWNGLRRDRHFMDQLLHEFFVLGRQFASVDVLRLTGLDAQLVGGVLALLEDLCARVLAGSANDEDGVPVLLEGGGRGMKVSLFHHPYLLSLKRVVAEAEHIAALKISIGDQQQQQQEQEAQQPQQQEDSDSTSTSSSGSDSDGQAALSQQQAALMLELPTPVAT